MKGTIMTKNVKTTDAVETPQTEEVENTTQLTEAEAEIMEYIAKQKKRKLIRNAAGIAVIAGVAFLAGKLFSTPVGEDSDDADDETNADD